MYMDIWMKTARLQITLLFISLDYTQKSIILNKYNSLPTYIIMNDHYIAK